MIGKSALPLLFISYISTATSLRCNETDALIQVKFNITQEQWDAEVGPPGIIRTSLPFLQIPGDYASYRRFSDLTDFEACLPRDDCSEVIVARLPTDGYRISFDGEPIDIGISFPFDGKNPITSTEVGNCFKPTCDADMEALVEVQFWSGLHDVSTASYRVEGKDGDVIVDFKPPPLGERSLTRNLACVPRNSCYTFLIGTHSQLDTTPFIQSSSYSVLFDGELVRKSDSWLFEALHFGDGCKPRCNQDESEVDFFMFQLGLNCGFDEDQHKFKWNLSLAGDDASKSISSGVVPCTNDTSSSLAHKSVCIPKGSSCSAFRISAPIFGRTSATYSLAMDGINYRKYRGQFEAGEIHTTNLGSCTVSDLCDEQKEDLLDLEMHTAATYERSGRSPPFIDHRAIGWAFFNHSSIEARVPTFDGLISSWEYNNAGYDLDSSYRAIECVPKGKCDYTFGMDTRAVDDGALKSYTVRQNGVLLGDSREVPDQFSRNWIMTPLGLGQNCFATENHSLSSGAIVGIIIACCVMLSILIGLIMVCMVRSEERKNEPDEEDPLNENLLTGESYIVYS